MVPESGRKITTVIVDDEPLARESLRARLLDTADIEIVGEAIDGPSAVKALRKLTPELVFLDIQMPGFDGFEVLRRVGEQHFPAVIFVTAYDRYAIHAFEVHAVDYLLKPVLPERLYRALQHMRESTRSEASLAVRQETLIRALYPGGSKTSERLEKRQEPITRVAVRHGDRYQILQTDEILWINSAANYVEIHARGSVYLLRKTMRECEERLSPRFVRIHRTCMVNAELVREVMAMDSGDFDVILRDGVRLRMSRSYKDNLFAHMKAFE